MDTQKELRAGKLINDINKKIDAWNERSQFTIKGVKNLSRADMDTLKLYCEYIIVHGSYDNLMRPVGGIADVLEKYDLT